MENNCLITTLKTSVNNESLKKLGIIRIPVLPYSGTVKCRIITPNDGDCNIKIYQPDGNLVKEVTSHDTDGSSPSLGLGSTGGYYEIDNKYAIISGIYGNINLENRDSLPNVKEFLYTSALTSISCEYAKGSIEDVAKIDSLTYIKAPYFTGDILDYIATRKQRSNSSTGEIPFSIYTKAGIGRPTITFNGKQISMNTYGGTETLCWDGNKAYLILSAASKAYTYGYTDEEIATMQTSGGVFENITNVIKVD